ncbi:MAG: hypothetical protein M1834_003151 [Cirrosporium novae-zelandiae]|nr:MAG: hypothetical protein M1834_003151 [Cirrosporium novae-zelandiae]
MTAHLKTERTFWILLDDHKESEILSKTRTKENVSHGISLNDLSWQYINVLSSELGKEDGDELKSDYGFKFATKELDERTDAPQGNLEAALSFDQPCLSADAEISNIQIQHPLASYVCMLGNCNASVETKEKLAFYRIKDAKHMYCGKCKEFFADEPTIQGNKLMMND